MELEQLKEIQALIKLASRQTDENLIYRVVDNLIKKLKKYKLDKYFKEDFNQLISSEKIENVFLALSKLLSKINTTIEKLNISLTQSQFYPNNFTANKIVLEKINNFIKNPRIKDKLRYLLNNLNNITFFRKHSKAFSSSQEKIDLFCLNLIVTNGITIRILYFLDNNKLRFCDFFVEHDKYEIAIKNGRFLKKNYFNENWFLIPRF